MALERVMEFDIAYYRCLKCLNLPKVFDCLSHNLLIAKLDAFRLNINSLNILQGYLGNRNQRTKVDFYSFWEAIRSGVPQC